MCWEKRHRLCKDLTEIDCETVPYTECKLYSKVQIGKRPKFVWKEYENCTCRRKYELKALGYQVKQSNDMAAVIFVLILS